MFGIVAWVLAIAAGNGLLYAYSFAPGRAAGAPVMWPAEVSISRAATLPTLVMAAHPRCSTRASIAELEGF